MSDQIAINITPDQNVSINPITLNQGLINHSVTHQSGGSDELLHNLLGGLQGGSGGQYYHLSSGQYFNLIAGTGSFYPNNNPSGFITGVDLTPYATVAYVTDTSGQLQAQITVLNNQTGSFYPRTNPSGYITGINNIVFTTGNQIISGAKTFTGSFNVSTNDPIIIRSTGYLHGIEIGGDYFNKIADGGFINDFGVDGTENHFGDRATSSNSFGGNAAVNDFGPYATLNNYYGGSVIGQFDFDTAPTFSSGEVRDSFIISSLGASENEDPSSLVLRSSLGYSVFSSVISRVGLDSANYNHNKITLTIGGDPPDTYTYDFPQASGTIALDSTAVMLQGNQIVNGVKNFTSIPTVNNTGILLSGSSYITGISGGLQNQITTLNNQTGSFYPRSNPSGFITGINNLVFTTGNQTISGAKTFSNNLVIGGNDLFVNTSTDRVGILTATPTATLDVNGSGLFRSGLNVTGNLNLTGSLNINTIGELYTPALTTNGPILVNGSYFDGLVWQARQDFNYVALSDNAFINYISVADHGVELEASTQSFRINAPTIINYSLTGTSGIFLDSLTAPNLVYSTGNQTIGGAKTFSNNLTVNGGDLFVDTSNNRVGVNTITPTATLDVNGTALFRSGLNISGTRPTVNSTGILLSGEATTQTYVTGISGSLQTQITTLNNQTGSYYPRTNPSGYITGVDLSFSGNYYTKNESESRYVNTTGAETILGDKTFHDKVYINNLYVTGLETIINTTNTNVASNYLLLNLTGGAVDGGIFFITGSGLSGINDSGAIIGFDHSDKFKFGIATRASDLSTLDTIASYEEVTGISGVLQTQISTLNSATGSYVLNSQTGQFYSSNNPSGYTPTGYVTGVSGNLQTQITNLNNATGSYVLNSQTGQFYPNSNPSGYLSSLLTNKTIYVDIGAGSDTRNGFSKYDLFKPFATISAAVNASAIGDTIYVRAGNHTIANQISMNGKGNLYFELGAKVTVSNNITAFSLTANESKTISGYGEFTCSGTGGLWTQSGGTNTVQLVTIQCTNIINLTGAGIVFNIASGVVGVDAPSITCLASTIVNITGTTSDCFYKVDITYCGKLVNIASTVTTGGFTANCWTVQIYGLEGVRIDGGVTSFIIENLVISIVAPAPIKAVAKPVVFGFANGDTATGSHTFRGGRIVNSHNDNPCITFNSTTATNKSLRLVGDVELQNRSTATNSISSANARNIVVSLAHATKPVSSNITIQGGTYMVDPIF
jgi:hypothetical protein